MIVSKKSRAVQFFIDGLDLVEYSRCINQRMFGRHFMTTIIVIKQGLSQEKSTSMSTQRSRLVRNEPGFSIAKQMEETWRSVVAQSERRGFCKSILPYTVKFASRNHDS